ncbi:hypothetical protein GCM10023194_40200 [Planotetraspora phitsanulokensis]|uniref:Polar amino acid transport system ATP-binding protein n=1 Tax=Planotetraspora phitsanulokensis TaxID=575192 RepID=A0A8J3U935_9ACTN|nr:hypothetical protein [Planotetraspora phitsanulokensis]GII40993.1 hypothetical protein Pph01_59960 [Planotetraspora phitsanulokensis]
MVLKRLPKLTVKNIAAHGMTMVIVAHEIAFAREVANRVVFMAKGYILEEQSPNVFFSNPGQHPHPIIPAPDVRQRTPPRTGAGQLRRRLSRDVSRPWSG